MTHETIRGDVDEERWLAPYASVVAVERAVGAMIHPRGEQSDLPDGLLQQMHDPSVLEDTPVYWFRTVASNASEDHMGTIMQIDSLRNYAQDATDGLPFCNSHQHDELPFGRTYAGRFHQGRGQSLARTEMDVYVPYDMNVNGVDTTHFIKAVRAGVARDVSIGFDPERIVCSLDGRNMPRSIMDLLFSDPEDPNGPCRHIPGVVYEHEGKKVRALGKIHGAHCIELSPVFRGATPGAAIVSPSRALVVERGGPPSWALQSPSLRTAALLAEANMLDRPSAQALEDHVRGVRFPSVTTRHVAGWSVEDERKEWDSAYVNSLPDSAFALVYTDDKGRKIRKLPHHDKSGKVDKPHLRNALARAPQMTDVSDAQKSRAVGHLEKHAKAEKVGDRAHDHEDDDEHFASWSADAAGPEPEPQPAPDPDEADPEANPERLPDPEPIPEEEPARMTSSSASADGASAVPGGPTSDGAPAALSPDPAAAPSAADAAPPPATRAATSSAPESVAAGAPVVPIWHTEVRGALLEAGLAPDGFDGDPVARLQELGRELATERAWAGWGRRYRQELCQDIEAEGVRAFGAESWTNSRAAYIPILERGTADDLLALRNHFREQAAQRLRGGRATRDDAEQASTETPPATNKTRVPSYAYRS